MKLKETSKEKRIDNQEWLVLQVALHIETIMSENKISRKELADRLGTTKGYVTQLLDGSNMTLRKVSDVMLALDSSLVIDHKPIGYHTTIKPKARDIFESVKNYIFESDQTGYEICMPELFPGKTKSPCEVVKLAG